MNLDNPIDVIKGIGAKKKQKLENIGIKTVWDLVNYKPVKYEDRRHITYSDKFVPGKKILAIGKLLSKRVKRISGGRTILDCRMADKEGIFKLSFFNMPYLAKSLNISDEYIVYGLVNIKNGEKIFVNPEINKKEEANDIRGILPVYRCTRGVTNKDFRKWMRYALSNVDLSNDFLRGEIINKRKLCNNEFAYKNIHFPNNIKSYQAAKYRLIYNELLIYQIDIIKNKKRISEPDEKNRVPDIDTSPFIENIGFKLTKDQEKVVKEIENDLSSDIAMNRLIQGDVGSGKTIVAEIAIYKVAKGGGQVAFMAPTEVLAIQHYKKLKETFNEFGISVGFLSGSMKNKEKNAVLNGIKDGSIDLAIGTHALIQSDVLFKNLKLVITDEQHRFGVNQRKNLLDKGEAVNIMVMSATPIPRTLATTLFGDMDFSIIKTMPSGRKKIITRALSSSNRELAYRAVYNEIEKGHQAYIVAPAIDDDNDQELKSTEKLYYEMKKKFNDRTVGLIHGRLRPEEKELVMQKFTLGEIDILVSTVVIEVGIDVKNATIIVIENAERYGLAQLHQLRGRIGRSYLQSYCYLIRYSDSDNALSRINAMVKLSDGFEISEEDFRLRGPGDIRGTIQHGNSGDLIRNIYMYEDLLEICTEDAIDIINSDFKTIDKEMLESYTSGIYNDYSYVI